MRSITSQLQIVQTSLVTSKLKFKQASNNLTFVRYDDG